MLTNPSLDVMQHKLAHHPEVYSLSDDALVALLTQRMQQRRDHLHRLSATYQALDKTHQQLARSEQIQGQFLSHIRDQFHDNLESMRVLLSALTRANLYDDDIQSFFEIMFADVLTIQFHMDNVSIASQIDSGELSASIEQIRLGRLIAPLEESLCHLLQQREDIDHDWQIDEDCLIYQDKEKLLLILRNALSNAIRFSSPQGKLTFQLMPLGDTHIEIIVSNQGDDIANKDSIFDTFYQEDSSYGRAQHGLGLGLSVVKGLVSFMNGDIEMSRVGDYNQLYIILPILANASETFECFSIDPYQTFAFDEEIQSGVAF
jgi:signal transduction histidine kinase